MQSSVLACSVLYAFFFYIFVYVYIYIEVCTVCLCFQTQWGMNKMNDMNIFIWFYTYVCIDFGWWPFTCMHAHVASHHISSRYITHMNTLHPQLNVTRDKIAKHYLIVQTLHVSHSTALHCIPVLLYIHVCMSNIAYIACIKYNTSMTHISWSHYIQHACHIYIYVYIA